MKAGTTVGGRIAHEGNTVQKYKDNASYCATLLLLMHLPTPAYCHGYLDIAGDIWFEHSHQLPV